MTVTTLPPGPVTPLPRQPWEIELAHHNLEVLRQQAKPWAVHQCEDWLDRHDPGWRSRPQVVG